MLVDDSEDFANLFKTIIVRYNTNCKIQVVSTGSEALDVLQKYNPDLIFTDINLPDISGLELIQIIQDMVIQDKPTMVIISGFAKDQIEKNEY